MANGAGKIGLRIVEREKLGEVMQDDRRAPEGCHLIADGEDAQEIVVLFPRDAERDHVAVNRGQVVVARGEHLREELGDTGGNSAGKSGSCASRSTAGLRSACVPSTANTQPDRARR